MNKGARNSAFQGFPQRKERAEAKVEDGEMAEVYADEAE